MNLNQRNMCHTDRNFEILRIFNNVQAPQGGGGGRERGGLLNQVTQEHFWINFSNTSSALDDAFSKHFLFAFYTYYTLSRSFWECGHSKHLNQGKL